MQVRRTLCRRTASRRARPADPEVPGPSVLHVPGNQVVRGTFAKVLSEKWRLEPLDGGVDATLCGIDGANRISVGKRARPGDYLVECPKSGGIY
jgi:hypothetical protein